MCVCVCVCFTMCILSCNFWICFWDFWGQVCCCRFFFGATHVVFFWFMDTTNKRQVKHPMFSAWDLQPLLTGYDSYKTDSDWKTMPTHIGTLLCQFQEFNWLEVVIVVMYLYIIYFPLPTAMFIKVTCGDYICYHASIYLVCIYICIN